MAEYINRERLKQCFHTNVCGGNAYDELIDMQPAADVVERSKIDKAVADLKTEYCECKKSCSECLKNDRPYMCTCSIPLHEVLEFLNDRRNIGE